MKSIIYTLIAIFICGIIASGFSQKPLNTYSIRIQSNDDKISSVTLSQSADIISMRLKSFGSEKFEVNKFPGKNQIEVVFAHKPEVQVMEKLITQKGMLDFYETYNNQELIRLLKGDSTLYKLLHTKAPKKSSSEIGCIPEAEMETVNDWLAAAGLGENCRFTWSDLFDGSNSCLYALRMDEAIALTGEDIQSMEAKFDTTRQKDFIQFKFKQPAIPVWADVTKRNLGKSIAIVMDGNVMYAPFVTGEITGGDCQISGDFTQTQVRFIAAIGTSGALPASFTVIK